MSRKYWQRLPETGSVDVKPVDRMYARFFSQVGTLIISYGAKINNRQKLLVIEYP